MDTMYRQIPAIVRKPLRIPEHGQKEQEVDIIVCLSLGMGTSTKDIFHNG